MLYIPIINCYQVNKMQVVVIKDLAFMQFNSIFFYMMQADINEFNSQFQYSNIEKGDMDKIALFLDIDSMLSNTLAPNENEVLHYQLGNILEKLFIRLSGALAIITGHSINIADRLIGKHLPIAGLHGSEIRDSSGKIHKYAQPLLFKHAKIFLITEAQKWPDLKIQDNGIDIGFHFPRHSQYKKIAHDLIIKALKISGPNYVVQQSETMVRLKPVFSQKDTALHFFMRESHFAQRIPICCGNDLTDEPMFQAARKYNGLSVFIGKAPLKTAARYTLASPEKLRHWLEHDLK